MKSKFQKVFLVNSSIQLYLLTHILYMLNKKRRSKPISRILSVNIYPKINTKVLSFIWNNSRPLFLSTYPPTQASNPLNNPEIAFVGLFGLSVHEVYHALCVTTQAVGSYSTFSPLPKGGIFSVALAVDNQSLNYPLPVR